MSNFIDDTFRVGEFATYKYEFRDNYNQILHEYIHCIILERLDEFDGVTARKIRVNQIQNLEEYSSDSYNYNDFSERVLITNKIRDLVDLRT